MSSSMWRACAGVFLCFLSPGLAGAATGDWDRSYGTEGHLSLTDWLTEPGGFQPSTWQPQADGKIVLAGWGHTASSAQSYWVVRLNADGTRDTSFGGGDGIATLNFGSSGWVDLAVLADGRILFLGAGTSSQEIRLVRLQADGSRDTGFATAGELVIGDTRHIENPRLAMTSDGSAIVAAEIGTGVQSMRVLVAKVTPAGVLDASFGTGGLTEVVPPFTVVEAGGLAVNSNGVIAIGGAFRQSIGRIPFVARLRSNGQPDSTFGTNGVVEVPFFNGDGTVGSVAVTADGKVVAAGEGGDSNGWRQIFIARFTTNGELDPSFGSGGRVVANGTAIAALLLEPDGKLVVAGDTFEPIWNIGWLARYNVDGAPDVTFGLRGSRPVDFAVMAGTRLQRLDRLRRDADGSYRAIAMAWGDLDRSYTLTRFMGSGGTSAGVIGIRNEVQYPSGQILRVTEDDTSMPLRVYRTGGTDGTVSVQYRVVGQTATAGQDFVGDPGTVTFNPGEASKAIYIPLLEDSLVESAEDLYVELFAPTGGAVLSRSRAEFGITDDDRVSSPTQPGAGISSDIAVNEGAGTATLTVTLAEVPNQNFNVTYWIGEGTATSHDITGSSGTSVLTWAAGDSAPKQIVVPIVDDSLDEIDETFTVYVTSDQGSVKRASASARVTIVDNDPTPAGQSGPIAPGILLSTTTPTVHEGDHGVPLTLSRVGGNHGRLDVDCAYVAGSATEPDDLIRLQLGASWNDGVDAARNFAIHLNGDAQVEADETFTLRCSPRMGLVNLTPVELTITIVDDDVPSGAPARVEFVSTAQSANENVTTVTLQVARSGNTSVASSVEYTTVAGTASTGDFTASSGALTWAANDVSTKLITVTLTPDSVDESDESFTISLRNASAGTELGAATATVTIVDDDGAAPPASNSGGGGGGQESWLALLLWTTLVALRRRAMLRR